MKGNTCTHSGKRYTFSPATKIYRLDGHLTSVKWRGLEAGVYIEDLEGINKGQKKWYPNSAFDHIKPLPFKDVTTRYKMM